MLSKGRLRSNGEAARKGPREVATSGAQEKRLANNTTTLAAEYAKQGKDWETELRQRATKLDRIVGEVLNHIEGGRHG